MIVKLGLYLEKIRYYLLSKRSYFLANGEYIAKRAADDIADKTRFAKQMDYITKYSYDVVGTNLEYINSHGEIIDTKTFP
ncbi:MAG: hypothetical protein AB8V03_05555 [Francisella endosymbiont of Hyalomma asiaticum]